MLESMRDLVRSGDVCVLATVASREPHTSFMAYAVDDACREIYLATGRKTKKYENVMANPSVSLLIDTREEDRGNRRAAVRALTVRGRCEVVEDPARRQDIRSRLRARHPHLAEILDDPDGEILAVKILSLQLLEGVSTAYYVALA